VLTIRVGCCTRGATSSADPTVNRQVWVTWGGSLILPFEIV